MRKQNCLKIIEDRPITHEKLEGDGRYCCCHSIPKDNTFSLVWC